VRLPGELRSKHIEIRIIFCGDVALGERIELLLLLLAAAAVPV